MEEQPSPIAYAVGGLLPIAVTAAMVGLRSEVDNTNVALLVVLCVVFTGAIGGRGPAILSAVVGALSYEFFFTRPYYSLRINDSNDLETTLILLVIGVAVGQIAVYARRQKREASEAGDELASMRRVAERIASGADDRAVIDLTVTELTSLLSLLGCRYEVEASGPVLPMLERSGRVEAPYRMVGVTGELALPPLGVRLPVVGGGRQVGSLVLDPDPSVGVSLEARLVAIALADQLGAALANGSRQDAEGSR
jgi:hypothetical protein